MLRLRGPGGLTWRSGEVQGRRVNYGVAGAGAPVLFLHGWALGSRAYKRALERVVDLGCEVYAPAMPGFGGTAPLPGSIWNLAGYGAWVADFLEAVGVDEPVVAVGHSFGGAVGIQLAHDSPGAVGQLVLVNSLGGSAWRLAGDQVRSMSERPLWDWALNFPRDVVFDRSWLRTVTVVLEDVISNLVAHPVGMCKVAILAMRADLTDELAGIRERRLPVQVLWGDGDGIVPRASFEAICEAVGSPGEIVPGTHSWLLAHPDAFAKALSGAITRAASMRAERDDSGPGRAEQARAG